MCYRPPCNCHNDCNQHGICHHGVSDVMSCFSPRVRQVSPADELRPPLRAEIHKMLLAVLPPPPAFLLPTTPLAAPRRAVAHMGLFDGLAGAFANEDLGERENAGLKTNAAKKTITWVGIHPRVTPVGWLLAARWVPTGRFSLY